MCEITHSEHLLSWDNLVNFIVSKSVNDGAIKFSKIQNWKFDNTRKLKEFHEKAQVYKNRINTNTSKD